MDTKTVTHTNSAPAPTPHPSPILLGTGPWIGDMWLGEMRHDAGLSIRQILCLSACSQITSLERLTKTEKEFCFLPFWLLQSPRSQPRSASGPCCRFSWHYLPPMAVAGYRNKFLSTPGVVSVFIFYVKLSQREAERHLRLKQFMVRATRLANPDRYAMLELLCSISFTTEQQLSIPGGLKPGDETVF